MIDLFCNDHSISRMSNFLVIESLIILVEIICKCNPSIAETTVTLCAIQFLYVDPEEICFNITNLNNCLPSITCYLIENVVKLAEFL